MVYAVHTSSNLFVSQTPLLGEIQPVYNDQANYVT